MNKALPKTKHQDSSDSDFTLGFPEAELSDFVSVASERAGTEEPSGTVIDQQPPRKSARPPRVGWLRARGVIHNIFVEGFLIWPGAWFLFTSKIEIPGFILLPVLWVVLLTFIVVLLRFTSDTAEYLAVFLKYLINSEDFDPVEALSPLLKNIKAFRRLLTSALLSLIGLGLALLL